ncbi:putative reverse transcriptase domain-containing protein [Tanacetum coccineum]
MKNHETRPTGTTPLTEANVATYNDHSGDRGRGRGYGRDRGQGRGFGRGNCYGVNHGVQFKDTSGYKKWQDKEKNEKDGDEKEKGVTADSCYRCGSFDHWAKHCHYPKDQTDATHLDDDDFLTNE